MRQPFAHCRPASGARTRVVATPLPVCVIGRCCGLCALVCSLLTVFAQIPTHTTTKNRRLRERRQWRRIWRAKVGPFVAAQRLDETEPVQFPGAIGSGHEQSPAHLADTEEDPGPAQNVQSSEGRTGQHRSAPQEVAASRSRDEKAEATPAGQWHGECVEGDYSIITRIASTYSRYLGRLYICIWIRTPQWTHFWQF